MSSNDVDGRPPESDEFALQYDTESGSFSYAADEERWSMSEAVVSAVAIATDRDPLALPPLYEAIDPDALDALVSPTTPHADSRTVAISFAYADCHVDVEEHSRIRVRSAPGTSPR